MSITFAYRARTPAGESVSGTMRALDRRAALATLRDRMLIATSLESSRGFSFAGLVRGERPKERLAFFRAYAMLEKAGVDFATSFSLLEEQAGTARMRDALASIRFDVERNGEKLWSAMAHRPREFSDLEIAMVAAGEEAGNREEVFDRLATFLERDERIRKQLSSALLYPMLVFTAATLTSLYLVAFVIPQFARLFDSFGVERSPLLSTLLGVTLLATNPFILTCVPLVAIAMTIVIARIVRTPEGAHALDGLRMRLPLAGEAIRKTTTARVCRVLATLLQSGVNAVRALEVAVPVAESPVYARAIASARDGIAHGRTASLDEALAESGVFPTLLLGFIRVGTSAGNVPAMLLKVAEYYEEDVETLLSTIPTVVQTIVTLALGLVVGVIVYVVYVPLSTLSSSIH